MPLYICEKKNCSYETIHSGNFKRHQRRHARKGIRKNASLCKSTLCDHAVCKECGIHITEWYNMKSHLVSCRKEKPFSCRTCDRSFSQKNSLVIHSKSEHHLLMEEEKKGESSLWVLDPLDSHYILKSRRNMEFLCEFLNDNITSKECIEFLEKTCSLPALTSSGLTAIATIMLF